MISERDWIGLRKMIRDKYSISIMGRASAYSQNITFSIPNLDFLIDYCNERDIPIVAQEHGLKEFEINQITGYSIKTEARRRGFLREEDVIETGPHYLDNLIDRINKDSSLDPQEELTILVKEFKHPTKTLKN